MAIENLTTYTEVDSAGDITVSTSAATFDTMALNAISYVWKDHGVDYFGAFEVQFEFEITNTSTTGAQSLLFALTNTVGTIQDLDDSNDNIFFDVYYNGSDIQGFIRSDGSVLDTLTVSAGSSITSKVYATVYRLSDQFTVELYSDSGRTSLIDSGTVTATSAKYRYMQVLASREFASAETISGYTQNFEILNASSSSVSSSSSSSSSSTSYEPYENLLTYTEVDSDGDYTITPLSLTFDTLRQDAVSYVYYDFGASYFGNFKIEFEATVSAAVGAVPDGIHFGLSNTIGTIADWIAANNGLMVDTYFSGGLAITRIMDLDDFSFDPYAWGAGSFVKHYFTVYRDG